MSSYVLGFREIDRTKLSIVGGKGANLGELSRIEGIAVPEGFCVTTEAYQQIMERTPELPALFQQLALFKAEDREGVRALSGRIRSAIEETAIPEEIAGEISSHLSMLGDQAACAVRSSATAEDLPSASFAGQQDTYLNIIGKEAILKHVSRCWASLFTERAVIYRLQNGFTHDKVLLSVVIQKMVFPDAAGILFTADPINGNRKVVSIDASFGLGEALVSGLVNADVYKARGGKIVDKKISQKKMAIYGLKEGGTEERAIEANRQTVQALTDEQILQLERIGRKIEAHFGRPQDIEWCLAGGRFFVVQSRPITTLYPLPEGQDDKGHVYMSFGHQQMMTDAMKPLGLSFFQFTDEMPAAGGRLFLELAHDLASPIGRAMAVPAMGQVDPLIGAALKELVKRKGFMKTLAKGKKFLSLNSGYFSTTMLTETLRIYRKNDGSIIPKLMAKNEAAIAALQQKFDRLSGDALLDAAQEDYKQLMKVIAAPEGMGSIWTGTFAMSRVNKMVEKWLGEKGVADALAQSAPYNVVGEMGLELLDVGDVVRQHPAVVDYFQHLNDKTFFEDLAGLEGGGEVIKAMRAFLSKYGMRCSGEIDITRPRWAEQPTSLVPLILSNIKNFEPGAHKAIFEQGLTSAEQKKQDVLSRVVQLPGGARKAKKLEKMIRRVRNFIGYREYPKYVMVWHYWLIKQAVLREAEKLAESGVLREVEDVYYLTFEEFREALRVNKLDYTIIAKRKDDFAGYEKLTPPRLMTSEGEIISGQYKGGKAPKGALPGIAASSGVTEGRAHVVLKLEEAHMEEGDILVTTFTDPSWTPIFVSIKGLVAEVGGVMTHGSVVAREYGLPAVVGVENATKLIKDGDRIRVNGTDGYVEIL